MPEQPFGGGWSCAHRSRKRLANVGDGRQSVLFTRDSPAAGSRTEPYHPWALSPSATSGISRKAALRARECVGHRFLSGLGPSRCIVPRDPETCWRRHTVKLRRSGSWEQSIATSDLDESAKRAVELALLIEDPDAPLPVTSIHLIATGILPNIGGLPAGGLNPSLQSSQIRFGYENDSALESRRPT